MAAYLVFKQQQTDGGAWEQLTDVPVEATTADVAIESVRTTAGIFVAVLVRGFRPRTHYSPPRSATPKRGATP